MPQECKNVKDKQSYDAFLISLDIARIRKIIDCLESLKLDHDAYSKSEGSIIPVSAHSSDTNPTVINDYIASTVTDHRGTLYNTISNNINSLYRGASSIRTYFTNFPWDEVVTIISCLQSTIKKKDNHKHEQYKSAFLKDLPELKVRLEYIVKIMILKTTGIRDILQDSDDQIIQYGELLTKGSGEFKFIHSEDTKPRGLCNIRKHSEQYLDLEKKDKIVKFVETLRGRPRS